MQLPVHITGIQKLTGGRLAVGVRETDEIRLYDRAGAILRTVGKYGAAPGQFESLAGPWLRDGDEIAAYDRRMNRMSVFDTLGRLRRVTTYAGSYLDSTDFTSEVRGVVAGRALTVLDRRLSPQPGIRRSPIDLILVDSNGVSDRHLGAFVGNEISILPPVNGFYSLGIPAFSFTTLIAAGPKTIAIADSRSYDIRLMTSDGALATIIRATVPRQRATDSDFRELAQANASGGDITDADVKKIRSNTSHIELPILHEIRFDHAGNLWVEEFARHETSLGALQFTAPAVKYAAGSSCLQL